MASPCCIRLNVGGKLFLTTAETLRSLPDTRLGRLASDDSLTDQPDVELFFDRNPKIINSLLDLYRTGELHLPKTLCTETVERELEFWEIPRELIRECCFRGLQERKGELEITAEIDRFLEFPFGTADGYKKLSFLGKVWLTMERPRQSLASKVWYIVYFAMVTFSILLFCLETNVGARDLKPGFEQDLARRNVSLEEALSSMTLIEQFFITLPHHWSELTSSLIFLFFLLEFLVRFLACPVKGFFVRKTRNWLELVLLLHNLALVFLDRFYTKDRFYFSQATTDALVFFYTLSSLKMLRILYVIKDFDMIKILMLSVKASLKELMLLAVCMLSLAILYGTAFYLVELFVEEFTFHTIPHGMWYAIVTMTTVGYGDVVPVSTLGKMLGTLCAFSGLITVALPVAVVASNFSRYHDNLACRTQLRTRLEFVKKRPELLPRLGENERVKDKRCYFRFHTKTGHV